MNIVASLLILMAIVQSILVIISLISWLRSEGDVNILLPGLGLIVSMPAVIVFLLILNIVFVVVAAIIKPRNEFFNVTRFEQNFEYPNDIFSGCGNGTLTLSLAKNPDSYDVKTDRGLRVCINDDDLEAISLAIFQISTGKHYDGEKSISELRHRNPELFQQSIPEYPMLGRINYIFEDYVFSPEEVKRLREECLKAKSIASNPSADLALRKLIYACDEALKDNFYLVFSCD